MRGCLLSLGCMGLLIGFAACGTGITAGVYHFVHRSALSDQFHNILPFGSYALEGELRRCRDLGVAAYNDVRCDAAWAEDRLRSAGCGVPSLARSPGAH
jgi:conjugative transfer region protein TrbK